MNVLVNPVLVTVLYNEFQNITGSDIIIPNILCIGGMDDLVCGQE